MTHFFTEGGMGEIGQLPIVSQTRPLSLSQYVLEFEEPISRNPSNRIEVNNHIRPADQQRCPGAGELRAILAERRRAGLKGFAVVGDVSKAHRRAPVNPSEWGLLACQAQSSTSVPKDGDEICQTERHYIGHGWKGKGPGSSWKGKGPFI